MTNTDLVSFDDVVRLANIESTELFKLSLLNVYRPQTIDNNLFFTKAQMREIVLRKDNERFSQ